MKGKEPVFAGAATAVITPFRNGEVDYDALGDIIDEQIAPLHSRTRNTETSSLTPYKEQPNACRS